MSDPIDEIRRLCNEHPEGVLEKIAGALGYDQTWLKQTQDDARDAARFRTLMKHCAEARVSYNRDQTTRVLKLEIKPSSCTSGAYRDKVARMVADVQKDGAIIWPDDPAED